MFEKKDSKYAQCSHLFTGPERALKLKGFNPTKYEKIMQMMGPHLKSLRKLGNPKVTIDEQRKTIQKSQVGEGILKSVENLILPAS